MARLTESAYSRRSSVRASSGAAGSGATDSNRGLIVTGMAASASALAGHASTVSSGHELALVSTSSGSSGEAEEAVTELPVGWPQAPGGTSRDGGGAGHPEAGSAAGSLSSPSSLAPGVPTIVSTTSVLLSSPGNRKPQVVQNFAPGRAGAPQLGQRSIISFRNPGFVREGAGIVSFRPHGTSPGGRARPVRLSKLPGHEARALRQSLGLTE